MSSSANDKFKQFYAEKMWELIPGVYRHEDGLDTNPNPGVLRAIIEVMAEQAAVLRRSQDRLWEDQFIEWCNDWAVPYIGDLLSTRLLSALNKRGRRIDVAKTIYYRRRKGMPQILEELISDISGWDGKLVEAFKRLVRARHGLDPAPQMFAERYTGTLPGGVADLRNQVASELSDGPFEEYFHTSDMRKPKGLDGRFGISKLNFYLYRLRAYPVFDSTPFAVTNTDFMFDPGGRKIPLFSRSNRPKINGWDQWHSAFEWELPAPIRCRLLGHAEYLIREEHIQGLLNNGLPLIEGDALKPLVGFQFRNDAELIRHTGFLSPGFLPLLMEFSIIQECGKSQLIPNSVSVSADAPLGTIAKEMISAANLAGWVTNAVNKQLVIDAELGKFMFLPPIAAVRNPSCTYYYGFSGPIGAGTYPRPDVEDSNPTNPVPVGGGLINAAFMLATAIVEVQDNKSYSITADNLGVQKFTFQSKNETRPHLQLSKDLVFDTPVNQDAELILDGLWFASPGDQQFNIILRGDYECVIVRNCTFDPGGSLNAAGENILPVSLIIEGNVEKMCIDSCIMGPILTRNNGLVEEELIIRNSIVQSVANAVMAIEISTGITEIVASTVFGTTSVHRLYASDSLFTGKVEALDTQSGCFRFSGAPDSSFLPGPYESFLFKVAGNHWFGSRIFGQPDYAQLTDTIPINIWRGAENGAEMGAFNSLLNAIKLDGLKAKIEEYMPFGLISAFVNQT